MEKLNDVCKMGDIRNKINDLVTNTAVITLSGDLSTITSQENGWYKWTGTISDVSGTWIITKMGTLYSATNIEDPRVVLNSTNLTNWYSPYGSWHV